MIDKKKALNDAQRQARRREKAAAEGLKSCSVGLIRAEHFDAFKNAGALSREGKLRLDNGQLFAVKTVERVVEKRLAVIDLSIWLNSLWPLVIAVGVGFLLGLVAAELHAYAIN